MLLRLNRGILFNGNNLVSTIQMQVDNRSGFVALDQLRTVDAKRLVKRLGRLSTGTTTEVLDTLQEMFKE